MTRKIKQPQLECKEFDIRLTQYGRQAALAASIAESRNSYGSKLGIVCTMSAAAGAALSMTPAAEAGIRYSGVVNNTVERPNPAVFSYPYPPQVTQGAFGKFAITNTGGETVGEFALAARAFNRFGYLGIAAFGSTPAIYNTCNAGVGPGCGLTDPNFQALGRPHPVNLRMRPSPVPAGVEIGPDGATFNEGTVPVDLDFFSQLPTAGNDDRSIRKWSYGSENINFHLWEGSPGTLSAGAFAGIKLTIDGQPHFGWIRIAIANENHPIGTAQARNGSPYKVTAIDWAYETTPNTPILAGNTGTVAGIDGDYNNDGTVDGLDYAVWRNHLGEGDETNINNNGDGGAIEESDFDYWKLNYGNGGGPGGGGTAVPEPASATMISLGVLALGAMGVRRHRRAKC